MRFYDEIKRMVSQRPLLTQLIIVNVAIFLLVRLIGIVALIGGWSMDGVIEMFALPADLSTLASRPWTVLTYMVFHYDVLHILFNMLFLYWLGSILLMRATPRQLLALYIYAGLGGAIAFVGMAQMFAGVGGWLLGSSASVMGIAVAAAVLMPDIEVTLLLVGRVRLKWLVCIIVALFVLGLTGNQAGTHVAHFGGIAVGVLFGVMLNCGVDITSPFNRAIDSVVNLWGRVRHPSGVKRNKFFDGGHKRHKRGDKSAGACSTAGRHDTTGPKGDDDARARRELDEILDKIKRSGYGALTADERRRLFDVSSRLK